MDEKKAIKWVQARLASGPSRDEAYQAGLLAIEALERQIPKKTITVDWAEEFEGALIEDKCPICGNYVHCLENFCICCGQAIDWSEEND